MTSTQSPPKPAMAATLGNTGGVFSPGTTKRGTMNMYDTAASNFQPLPSGPFEDPNIADQPAAQDHFNSTREIKLKDRHGMVLPPSSYQDHYIDKGLPHQEPLPEDLVGPGPDFPFDSRTEYTDQYYKKGRAPRPVEPLTVNHRPPPWLAMETTNQAMYKPYQLEGTGLGTTGPSKGTRPAVGPPGQMPSIWETTYGREYVPKESDGRPPVGSPEPRPKLPWLAGDTTYRDHYVPKDLALQLVLDGDGNPVYPFSGVTEYQDEFTPKDAYPVMPPLTGFLSREGLQLPLPRRSLGVEFWHRGKTDQYFVLIPRTTATPCSARQVFTTLHDNQEQACILILYGDDPIASNNVLLGQFDIVNIPPAPKDVPRIEVKFNLSKDCYLTVEARDLDADRHKLWLQRGEIVVLKK